MALESAFPVKPKLRGVLHEMAFFASLVSGPLLVALAKREMRVAVATYCASMSALFGISALYHRPNWRPEVRRWLRKLDHSGILILIAGTATPLTIWLGTPLAKTILVSVWAGALLGVCFQMVPVSVPKPVAVIPYIALGWLGIPLLPATYNEGGFATPTLLLAGGVIYTIGAVVYARRSPNPAPHLFGYHEIFHAAVVVAAYLHYACIAMIAVTA